MQYYIDASSLPAPDVSTDRGCIRNSDRNIASGVSAAAWWQGAQYTADWAGLSNLSTASLPSNIELSLVLCPRF